MSRYLQHNEMTYELHDNELQCQHRRVMIRIVYAYCDPGGWDAQKVDARPDEIRAAFNLLKEVHARQQAAHHPGAGVAGHVSGGAEAHDEERVAAGLP